MDWITDTIAISNYLEAQDSELLRQSGFRSALSLDGTLSQERAVDLGLEEVVTVRLVDGAGNDPRLFQRAVESLVQLAACRPPVLVQCHAGRSRSAVVVAGYLVLTQALEPEQAIARVAARRWINISAALEPLLDNLEGHR